MFWFPVDAALAKYMEDAFRGAMEKLDSYLSLIEDCVETVQKMPRQQFNSEQCGYLSEKLKVVVRNARSFSEVLKSECHGLDSSEDIAKWVENLKFLLALAKQIVSFVQGCCKAAWIEAAMTLTNVSEYVSSLGFKLELCRVAFCKESASTKSLTSVEVGNLNRVEVEIVEKKAALDLNSLFLKVTKELNSLRGENRDLAAYLLQRLLRDEPNPTSDDGGFWDKLFKWVKPGEQLGRGTSATVHKATWLGIAVAQKTFDGSEHPDFVKEVKILSQLYHPNIRSMFCCAKKKRRCSIIMELMDGDLCTLMDRRLERLEEDLLSGPKFPFPILEAIDIMHQIGEGVNYLHRKGIVHRDLKSKNILVRSMEPTAGSEIGYVHVKVADFGISKANIRSTTYSNQTCNTGTFRWMAPEVIKLVTDREGSSSGNDKKRRHPFKCDTYSFALVCLEILTGSVPFPDIKNSNEVKKLVMNGERPDLPETCPPRLKALIKKCWDQDPKKRPSFDTICLELKYLKYLLMQGRNVDPMEKLDSYLSLIEDCVETVQKMPRQQFNSEQCGYLSGKLEVVVRSARSFSEVFKSECHGLDSSEDIAKWVENLKFLLALAKQIVSFVQGCCKDAWIEAAMTLTNVSEYVSSLGFKLELCRVAFCKESASTTNLTSVEVGNLNSVEVEIVEKKAALDVDSLFRKVTKELNSLHGENRDLAAYLLQRLLRDEPNPTSDDGGFWDKLFKWVMPGEQLGRGTSATVHKATWLGIAVAQKTFDGSENPDFVNEVKILSQLYHPNIRSMFCCAKKTRRCSIIMELMDGDLCTLMDRRLERLEEDLLSGPKFPFPILEAIDIMHQIGEGVNFLHRKGIVHRDLKSKKILVRSMEPTAGSEIGYVHVKVAGFCISKANMRSTTYSSQTYNVGTSRWMPPEVIKLATDRQGSSSGNDEEPRHPFKCDTYSFALVCLEILTGSVPFPDIENLTELKKLVMNGKRPDLPETCPPRLKALIKKCWDQDPKKRPSFDTICLELKYLKYLLMQGGIRDNNLHNEAADDGRTAADLVKQVVEKKTASASSDDYSKNYDVFLSHGGPDTNTNRDFVSFLDEALKRKSVNYFI